MKENFCNGLKNIDFFGEEVKLSFQSKSKFASWPGAFFSCAVYVMFIGFFVVRTGKIAMNDDPFFSMTTMGQEEDMIDLKELKFFFAIEKLDPKVGRIIVTQNYWDSNMEAGKSKTEIEMVDCFEFMPGGKYDHLREESHRELLKNVQLARKSGATFLCPANVDSMPVRGSFSSELFDYVRIKVEGCDLGAECMSDAELMDTSINYISLSSHPNLLNENLDEVVSFKSEVTYFKYIDPLTSQNTNLFFTKS